MRFTLSKTPFNLNVFPNIFDFKALGLDKLFVRDEHIFATRSYLLRKSAKKKCRMDILFFVSEGNVFWTS